METFEYNSQPARIIFGSGTIAKLPQELERLEKSNPIILSTPQQVSQADNISKILNGRFASIFGEAEMHTPFRVTERARAVTAMTRADSIVSIGGGSTIGLGKAISVRTGLPHIAIPTSYTGSEVTPILGETKNGIKETTSDPKIRPAVVIYDVDLTLTLPVCLTATSGINAIAHAVEALYAWNVNPITSLYAREGIRAIATALPKLITEPHNKEARTSALYGAWLCGTCLGAAGMSLHHKLCHTLGGSFDLPHAETHTIILPHALAYNAPKIPETMAVLASVIPESDGDAIHGLNVLLIKLGVQRGLRDLGMKESDVEQAADIAVSKPYWNPREIGRDAMRQLLRRAWAGDIARADI
jgi:alcohol dehydrogenase class IV